MNTTDDIFSMASETMEEELMANMLGVNTLHCTLLTDPNVIDDDYIRWIKKTCPNIKVTISIKASFYKWIFDIKGSAEEIMSTLGTILKHGKLINWCYAIITHTCPLKLPIEWNMNQLVKLVDGTRPHLIFKDMNISLFNMSEISPYSKESLYMEFECCNIDEFRMSRGIGRARTAFITTKKTKINKVGYLYNNKWLNTEKVLRCNSKILDPLNPYWAE